MEYIAEILINSESTLFSEPMIWLNKHGINILVILIGTWIVRRLSTAVILKLISRAIRSHHFALEADRKKRIDTLKSLIRALSKIIAWVVATLMIVDELGINTTPLLASAGLLGVVIGIGAQSFIKDLSSGLFIIIENQYRVGDVVSLDVGGQAIAGTVEGITIRTTILRDVSGIRHHIPNGNISVASNKTFGFSKLNEVLVVDTSTNISKLEKIINEIGQKLANDPEIGKLIRKAPVMAQVQGYTELGLKVFIRGETTPGGQWVVQSELFKQLQQNLSKAKIKIATTPFTQRTTQ